METGAQVACGDGAAGVDGQEQDRRRQTLKDAFNKQLVVACCTLKAALQIHTVATHTENTPQQCMLGERARNDRCHAHVCQQHVLLHQKVGSSLLIGAGRHWVAASVQCKRQAGVVEAQSTRPEARLAEARGDAVEGQAVVLDLWVIKAGSGLGVRMEGGECG